MTGCPDADALHAYVTGATVDVTTIIRHVESCEGCRQLVVELVLAARIPVPPPTTNIDAWLAIHRSVRPLRDLRNRRPR